MYSAVTLVEELPCGSLEVRYVRISDFGRIDSNFHFLMPLNKGPSQSGPQVLSSQNAIKIYRKKPTCFFDLFTDMQHKVLHQKPGVAHLYYPKWYSSTHPGLQLSGFPWRSERQSQPCTFRSCGAESRPSAWCLRNPPQASGPQSFQRIGDN